jgi:hypothetical protein
LLTTDMTYVLQSYFGWSPLTFCSRGWVNQTWMYTTFRLPQWFCRVQALWGHIRKLLRVENWQFCSFLGCSPCSPRCQHMFDPHALLSLGSEPSPIGWYHRQLNAWSLFWLFCSHTLVFMFIVITPFKCWCIEETTTYLKMESKQPVLISFDVW